MISRAVDQASPAYDFVDTSVPSILKFPTFPPTEFPPDAGDNTSELPNLRACYERFVLPEFTSSQVGTKSAYNTALNHWEQHAGDPPLYAITNETLYQFRNSLLETGMANATVMKYWRHLRAVLRRIGPNVSGNPQGEGLIERVPHLKPLPRGQKIPRVVDVEMIERLYKACEVATWPKRTSVVPAPALWRCALVLFCNYGPRTFDVFRLTWANILWNQDRLVFTMDKTHKTLCLQLNDVTRWHLESVKGNPDSIFAVTKSRKSLYDQWDRIQAAAGIPEDEHVEFRDLRETCNTWYERVRPGIGRWILGHAARGVNEQFYYNPTQEIAEAVEQLPQPAAFLKPLS